MPSFKYSNETDFIDLPQGQSVLIIISRTNRCPSQQSQRRHYNAELVLRSSRRTKGSSLNSCCHTLMDSSPPDFDAVRHFLHVLSHRSARGGQTAPVGSCESCLRHGVKLRMARQNVVVEIWLSGGGGKSQGRVVCVIYDAGSARNVTALQLLSIGRV